MSFTTYSTAIAGSILTAAFWNQQVRDNGNVWRGGGIAITSQAALDFIYASSSTQFARVAAVTGAFSRVNAAGAAWELHKLGYAPTLANVSNTAAKTAAVSVTIPAGDLTDGSVVTIQVASLVKNNKGTAGTVLFGLSYAGVADVSPTESAVSWANDVNEYLAVWRFTLQRAGSDLWVVSVPFNNASSVQQLAAVPEAYFSEGPAATSGGSFANGNAKKIVAPDFTTSQTLTLNITLSAADATFYVKPQSASVRRMTL